MLNHWIGLLTALPPVPELLLKITMLFASAWIFRVLVARGNPRWRVFYWRGVTAAAVLMTAVILLGPSIPVPLLTVGSEETETADRDPAPAGLAERHEIAFPGIGQEYRLAGTPQTQVSGEMVVPPESEASQVAERRSASGGFEFGLSGWLLAGMWLVPASLLLAGMLLTEWRTARLVRNAEAAPRSTVDRLFRIARDMGYVRPIRVRIASGIRTPAVAGLLHPCIILPKSSRTGEPHDLRGILAHEISHVASHDLIWSRVIQLFSIAFWFHPLVWGIGRQHLDACERVSDAVAADYVGDRESYARTLARVALDVIGHRRALAGIAMARSPQIHARLRCLANVLPATPLPRRRMIMVAAAALIVTAGVGGLQLVEAKTSAVSVEPAEAESPNPDSGQTAGKTDTKPAAEYPCRLVDVVTGTPVAGATVTVQRLISGGGKGFRQWPVRRETDHTTDADGRYTIDILPGEHEESHLYIQIRTKHPDYVGWYAGYSYSMIKKNLKMGSEPFFKRIEVWPAVKLTGKVVTPDGTPAVGVSIFGYSKFKPGEFEPRGFFIEGETDEEGTFELNAVRGGKSVVWLSPKEYCPSTHIVDPRLAELGKTAIDYLKIEDLVPDAVDEAVKSRDLGRFVLEDGIRIDGRIVDVDGKPLEGVWVNASIQEGPAKKEIGMNLADHIDRSALTDADGRYRMGPLPPSTYRVGPWAEPRERSVEDDTPRPVPAEFFPQSVKLEESEKTVTVDFQAVPSATIVAQYYDSLGKPRSGHTTNVSGKYEGEFYWKRCPADGNGRIEFTLPIGLENARLNLITNEHSALRHRVADGEPLKNQRSVELGTISGDMTEIAIIRYVAPILLIRIVDDEGRQMEGVRPRLAYAPERVPSAGEFVVDNRPAGHVSLEDNGDGRWRTSQLLPDEDITLTVEADGYETASQTLSLPEGEVHEIDVKLTKAVEEE